MKIETKTTKTPATDSAFCGTCTVQLVEYFPEENNLAVVYFTKILKLIQPNISYEENTLADYFARETTLGERFLWGKNFNKPCVKEINSSGIFPGTTTTTLYRTISDGEKTLVFSGKKPTHTSMDY